MTSVLSTARAPVTWPCGVMCRKIHKRKMFGTKKNSIGPTAHILAAATGYRDPLKILLPEMDALVSTIIWQQRDAACVAAHPARAASLSIAQRL